MKKQLLAFLMLLNSVTVFCQISASEEKEVKSLINQNIQGLSPLAVTLDNYLISSTYITEGQSIRMVYLQQSFNQIPVFNQLITLAFKQGKLVSHAGKFIAYLDQLVNSKSVDHAITAKQGIQFAFDALVIRSNNQINITRLVNGKYTAGLMEISQVPVTAELVWVPVSEKSVHLAWQVEIAPLKTSDHWLLRVDAINGQLISKNNYTVNEHFGEIDTHSTQESKPSILPANLAAVSPAVVNGAGYRVIPFPAESPTHAGGAHALVTDPWLLAPGNATSLKWHYDGTTYHDSTRGNNVWAQEDRANTNTVFGAAAPSTTPQPNLTFNYSPNYTLAPTEATNQKMAITNLFYWNNLIHDLTYVYGFNEVAGNFQTSNQGRGGLGNDYVIADAQDAGGTNNANFATPPDGSNPRMQMYLWTGVTPNRDGDLDNGIIAHEYGHGLSNRLTGGPANSSCLGNAEQGGEGWSDYLALMMTTNWATATTSDGTLSRPIGTYALNQLPTGAGIRNYPYSTNISVNPWTYAMMTGSSGAVHTIGQIWCVALWEMTWEMIQLDGINPNIFNPSAIGGNSAALKLVIEGMRLQPCSPGFIDARNAILKADTLFFNAKYSCAIWKAFAKRGMGVFASQGSSSSTTDQVADFTNAGSATMRLTQSVTQQQEGLNITYTTTISSGNCNGFLNYTLRDTLPLNVTYISGGSYNSSNRVVSFPVNLNTGQSQNYSFTVLVNNGAYYPPVSFLNEKITTSTIPSSWSASSTTTGVWTVSGTQTSSAPFAFFTPNLISTSDQRLQTVVPITLPLTPPQLSFQGNYNAESNWDGGVVEISNNGGTTWVDLGSSFISGGYTGLLNNSGANPLKGRNAFTGISNGFVKSTVNLSAYGGQDVLLRFRFCSDESVAGTGWYVDDILITDTAKVYIRSALYNNLNTLVLTSDTTTIILPGVICISGQIATQPQSIAVCRGTDASFSVNATGDGLTYQWQLSTDGGSNFNDIPGAGLPAYTVTGAAFSANNNRYRCVINGTCTNNLISDAALLTVNQLPVTPGGNSVSACGSAQFTLTAIPGAGETIDWFTIPSGGNPVATATNTFQTALLNLTTTYFAEAKNSGTGCISASRKVITASINSIPLAPSGNNGFACSPGSVTISATPGSGETIDWYFQPTGGLPVSSGSLSYTTSAITASLTYYAQARNLSTNCISISRTPVLAEVGAVSQSNTPISICASQLPYSWNNNTYIQGGTFQVVLVNAVGCDSIANLLLDVIANFQLFTVIGGGSFNAGGAGVPVGLSGSQQGVPYQLLLNGNPVGSALTGNGNALNFGLQTAAGVYTVVAGATAACPLSMTGSAIVIVGNAPPAPFAVTGGGTYCTGGVGLAIGLSGSEAGISYQLTRSNGTVNVGAAIVGTGTAINFGVQPNADTYAVTATNTLTLVTVPMLNTVNIRLASARTPSSPSAVAGPADVCAFLGQAPVTYTIREAANATSYVWTAPGGATIIGSNTDTIVQVQFSTSFVSGNLSVYAVNACFNNATSSTRNFAVRKLVPSIPGTITASLSNPCSVLGTTNPIIYSIRKVANATSYNWSVTSGMNMVINPGDTSIRVTFNSGFTTGNVRVTATNNCSTSAARSLTVKSTAPSAPALINGLTNVCSFIGQSTTSIYSITPVNGALSYLWTAPSNAAIVAGQGTTAVELSFATSFTGGNLTVRAISNCGNSSARSLALTRNVAKPGLISGSGPSCPLSTVTYTIAPVPFASSYLWSLPNDAIYVSGQGTTSFTVSYKATFVSGLLTVKSVSPCSTSAVSSLAVDNTGCSAQKSPQTASLPITKMELDRRYLNIFPNPGDGRFMLELHATATQGQLQLYDQFGRKVFEQRLKGITNSGWKTMINASALTSGMYELRFNDGINILSSKLLITK